MIGKVKEHEEVEKMFVEQKIKLYAEQTVCEEELSKITDAGFLKVIVIFFANAVSDEDKHAVAVRSGFCPNKLFIKSVQRRLEELGEDRVANFKEGEDDW